MAFNIQAARKAGYTDQEINQYLASKVANNQTTQQVDQPQGNMIGNLLTSIAEPFVNTAKSVGGAGYELMRAGQGAFGINNANENPFITDQEAQKGDFLNQGLKNAAGVGAWAVPIGGGLTGALLGGAGAGALDAYSRDQNILGGALGGGLTGGVLHGAAPLVSKGLKNIAQDLGLRKFGLSAGDITGIAKNTGQDVNKIIENYGLTGKTTKELPGVIAPYQEEFNRIVNSPDLNLNGQELIDNMMAKANELKASNFSEIRNKGAQLEEYVNNLKGSIESGKVPTTGAGLTQERMQADDLIKKFANDETKKGYAQLARDTLQNAIRDQADKLGLTTASGQSLRSLGNDLNALYSLSEKATERAGKGKGTYPLGLLETILGGAGATAGSFLGGPVGTMLGAGAGYTASKLAKSPELMAMLAKIAQGGANVAERIGQGTGNKLVDQLLGSSARLGGAGIGETLTAPSIMSNENQQTSNNTVNNSVGNVQNSNELNTNASIPQQQQLLQGQQQTTGQLISQNDLLKLILLDPKNAGTYKLIADLQSGPKQKAPSATQQKEINYAKSGLQSVNDVEKMLKDDPSLLLKYSIPGSPGARKLDAAIHDAADAYGRSRSGGAINGVEAKNFLDQMPKLGDSAETIKYKIDRMRTRFNETIGQSGSPTDVTDIQGLMQMLGGGQ